MRKNRFVLGAAVLVIALFFTACPGATNPETTGYTVTAQASDNGSLRFEPAGGPAGTPVKIWADPAAGYLLKELKAGGKEIDISAAEPWEITLTGDVVLTAVFETVPADSYTVTIAALQHGSITAKPKYGTAGTQITLTITPDAGYGLTEGSLTYSQSGSGPSVITGNSFALPAGNVTVTAVFEPKTAEQLVAVGTESLANGNFEAAIDAFESAYQKDKNNTAATIYSSLGALASIAKDQKVRDLVINHLGATAYPGSIGKLITTDWMETYTDETLKTWYYADGKNYSWYDPAEDGWFFDNNELEPTAGYYWWDYDDNTYTYHLAGTTPQYNKKDEKLPGLFIPDWFKQTGAYKDNLTSGGGLQAAQWPLLLMANLVEKNQNGLNNLLDGILSSVFGAGFENAAARFANLAYDQSVQVDEGLIAAFGLSELLEGDDISVGKAELDILFASLRLFKASLEWVAAYDWDTDISFLRTDWQTLEDNIAKLSPKNLPFGNNFMKNRNNGMMDQSKADFDKALTAAIAAYGHLTGEDTSLPKAYQGVLEEYEWIKDGLSALKSAIKDGKTFYVPDGEPSGGAYPTDDNDALLGIDMGKLFIPGQFAIDKLIAAGSNGAAPAFYAFPDKADPFEITGKTQLDSLGGDSRIGFILNLDPIKEVLVHGGFLPDDDTLPLPLFPAKIGKDLYGLYHK
ncbi:MAG: hypothetical protein LBE17_12215 [Treponema sp.]|nr:hypothetical protein [Treponema sp.]